MNRKTAPPTDVNGR